MALTICFIRLLNLGSHFIITEENKIYTESWLTRSIWWEFSFKAEVRPEVLPRWSPANTLYFCEVVGENIHTEALVEFIIHTAEPGNQDHSRYMIVPLGWDATNSRLMNIIQINLTYIHGYIRDWSKFWVMLGDARVWLCDRMKLC